MAKGNKVLGFLQKLGKSLMVPIAVLPAAALLLRLGQPDIFNLPWMSAAGDAVFGNLWLGNAPGAASVSMLGLLFAIGVAVGFAEENNGVAGIAATVGYFVMLRVATTINPHINMGVFGGIIAGVTSGLLYNRFKDIQVPQMLGFFGGKRFVPIVTSVVCLLLGVLAGWGWIRIQWGLDTFGNTLANAGPIGAFIFGVLNRLLIPIGLHHVLNTVFWFQFGDFTNAAGAVVHGDLTRFFAGDKTAGMFMTGFFPIMMFGLPAACLAMITTAKPEKRKEVAGMLIGIAFTSFLTGITEPIEFTFMFLAPVLYGIHAVLTGAALAVTNFLGIKAGFGFSAGLLDYGLNFGIATKPILLIVVGLIFAVVYYIVFVAVIKGLNLKTPGREDDVEEDVTVRASSSNKLSDKAIVILDAIGGKGNIDSLDACVTRIRVTLKDGSKVNEATLKKAGASGVMKMGSNNFQIVVGTIADPLVSQIKKLL